MMALLVSSRVAREGWRLRCLLSSAPRMRLSSTLQHTPPPPPEPTAHPPSTSPLVAPRPPSLRLSRVCLPPDLEGRVLDVSFSVPPPSSGGCSCAGCSSRMHASWLWVNRASHRQAHSGQRVVGVSAYAGQRIAEATLQEEGRALALRWSDTPKVETRASVQVLQSR